MVAQTLLVSLLKAISYSKIIIELINLAYLSIFISTRIQSESKTLITELKRNRDYYGNGDIFVQKNIDLVNQYLVNMESYTIKDLKKVKNDRNFIVNIVKSERIST